MMRHFFFFGAVPAHSFCMIETPEATLLVAPASLPNRGTSDRL
jgi:hypothetical protein